MPTEATTACPPAAELERLVRGRLTEARTAALAEHVGACSRCQQRLEALTAGSDSLTANLRQCAQDTPPTDSAYYKALAAAEEDVRATAAFLNGVSGEHPSAGLKLDFLQPSSANDNPEWLGRLGQFGVVRVVGRGGMGVVLHAYDPCLTRDVAVKVIDPRLANNEVARQRFCREARAAAAVTHENLVAVHQVDEDEASGLPYLVMQLVNGESLEQRLKRVGKISPPEVARMGMQAAAGLAAAHAGGLIHRDIKPGNILLESPADRVKLTDFGLARAAEDVKLTRTGFVAGSPLYMAPEQARGEEVDHRADLFSLGSVLYESLTGTAPFDGKSPLVVLRRVADETPPLLHLVNPDIPEWLSEAVARLLEKNPADRFQSSSEVAEVFAAELARWHALSPLDVPADVCPLAARSGTARQTRKHICWKSVAFRVLPWLAGAAVGALLLWVLWTPTPTVAERVVEVPPTPPAPEIFTVPLLFPLGAPLIPAPGPAPKVVLQGESGAVWAIGFSPNADRLIMGMEDGSLKMWDLKRAAVLKTLEPRQAGNIWTADVSVDGKYLVTACDDSAVTLWNLETYQDEFSFPQPTSTKAAVFSPIGKQLATGDRNSTVRVWDWVNQIPVELRGHRGTVHGLAYSPDGTRLASAGSDGSVKVWDLQQIDWNRRKGPEKWLEMAEHHGPVYAVAFSPDGTKLASAGWDGTVRVWDAAKGTQLQTIKAHDGDVWGVAFGGNGKWVASAGSDGAVRVWEVETGKEVFTYRGGRAYHTVRFAKDGITLAAGGRDGTVKVWEISAK